MKCTVFYDSWQMECCGTPFSVGDIVKWLVLKAEQLNTPVNVGAINYCYEAHSCNGVQREHNIKLNNGLPILHKVPPKRDYGRYFCIMAEKGGTSHGA